MADTYRLVLRQNSSSGKVLGTKGPYSSQAKAIAAAESLRKKVGKGDFISVEKQRLHAAIARHEEEAYGRAERSHKGNPFRLGDQRPSDVSPERWQKWIDEEKALRAKYPKTKQAFIDEYVRVTGEFYRAVHKSKKWHHLNKVLGEMWDAQDRWAFEAELRGDIEEAKYRLEKAARQWDNAAEIKQLKERLRHLESELRKLEKRHAEGDFSWRNNPMDEETARRIGWVDYGTEKARRYRRAYMEKENEPWTDPDFPWAMLVYDPSPSGGAGVISVIWHYASEDAAARDLAGVKRMISYDLPTLEIQKYVRDSLRNNPSHHPTHLTHEECDARVRRAVEGGPAIIGRTRYSEPPPHWTSPEDFPALPKGARINPLTHGQRQIGQIIRFVVLRKESPLGDAAFVERVRNVRMGFPHYFSGENLTDKDIREVAQAMVRAGRLRFDESRQEWALPPKSNPRRLHRPYAQWEAQLKRELKSIRYPQSFQDFKDELRSPTQTGDEALREAYRAGEDPYRFLQVHGEEMGSSLRYNPSAGDPKDFDVKRIYDTLEQTLRRAQEVDQWDSGKPRKVWAETLQSALDDWNRAGFHPSHHLVESAKGTIRSLRVNSWPWRNNRGGR